ncbi:hypothetical protein ACOMHN_007582 [Nucella lapillus]
MSICPPSSVLHAACMTGDVDTIRQLVLIDADANRTEAGNTPLHTACHHGHTDAVRALLKLKADINAGDGCGDTPLANACFMQHLDMVQLLLLYSADPNVANLAGMTPLARACFHGHRSVVHLLLSPHRSGLAVDVNVKDIKGLTPLHVACREGDLVIVKLLMDNGAGSGGTCMDESAPLALAFDKGHAKVVEYLLEPFLPSSARNLSEKHSGSRDAPELGNKCGESVVYP